MSDSLRLHGLQHARLLCPPLSSVICSDSCPLSRWCYLNISSSAAHSSLAFSLAQQQGLFQWVNSLHEVAKVLEFQLQHQSFQWTWVWVNSRSWWWTGRPGVLRFMWSQSTTEQLTWTELKGYFACLSFFCKININRALRFKWDNICKVPGTLPVAQLLSRASWELLSFISLLFREREVILTGRPAELSALFLEGADSKASWNVLLAICYTPSIAILCRVVCISMEVLLSPGADCGLTWIMFSSVAQSCPTLWPHGLQHARLLCPLPMPRA